MALYNVKNISYDFEDTEGYDEKSIPKNLIVEINEECDSDDSLCSAISDEIANMTGLCVFDYDYESVSFKEVVMMMFQNMAGKGEISLTDDDLITIGGSYIKKASVNLVISKLTV